MMDISCAILAGGKSTRFGKDKATTLEINGKPLICTIWDIAKRVFKDVVIVSKFHNTISGIDTPIIKDSIPVHSPMAGIVSALLFTKTPYVFILACDMPNISEKALSAMIEEVSGEDIIIPKIDLGYEPLHAIYNRSCISPMLTLIERQVFHISALFPYLVVKELKERTYFFHKGHSIFMNINTKEDIYCVQRLGL